MGSYTITITPDDDRTMTTTLRVDLAKGEARITDLHLHANEGLSAGRLPSIDFGLLLRAVSAEAPDIVATPAAENRPPATRSRARATERPARPAKVAKKGNGKSNGGERAYRRMPDDFAEVYQRLGGATAAARHYQVPRHTANGWIRRLRDQGILPA